ncbi:MAG: metallophosphoesterase [Sarcina sp.]
MKTMKKSTIMFLLLLYTIVIYYTWEMVSFSLKNYVILNYDIVFWGVVLIVGYSYGISLLFYEYLPKPISSFFTNISTYWMAFLLYCFIIFPLVNIIILVGHLSGTESIALSFKGFVLILVLTIVTSIKGTVNAIYPHVVKFNLVDNKKRLREPLNVILISDIHLGITFGIKRLVKMVDRINTLNPDVVLIAGDIVDSSIGPFIKANMSKEFGRIKSRFGTFAVLGNHDLMMGKGDEISMELKKYGVNVLRDERILINNEFYLIGRDDITSEKIGKPRKEISELIKNIDDSKYKMLIDHNPKYSHEAEENKIDVQFSGHTHKGQLRPWGFAVKRMYEIDHGYLKKENFNLFVSSGYGTSGPRLRTGSKAEIVQVIIR